MFNHIKELSEKLSLEDNSNYVQCKKARRILQEIKTEAQKLRNKITEDFKLNKNNKNSKEKVSEKLDETQEDDYQEKIIEPELEPEPKLVDENDDDFFEKQ